MERVQFQQEQMLAELKDMVEKGLFTLKETKQIIKKRTVFETALVRRVAKKADFLRYASYEMGLEQLRRKRVQRLKLPTGPATVSDYALVRRQFHIFERALKKFKSDVALWMQYIHLAKTEGARALVGRITARALQLHPNTPALYILAASHELDHHSPSAARILLQRGLRLNSESVELWREYVKMELAFIESLRRRWDVLGISEETGKKGKGKSTKASAEDGETDGDRLGHMGPDAELEGDQGATARNDIMGGAIVRSVISSAAQALPTVELFVSLKAVITEYPSRASLREANLAHLYDVLRLTLPDDARASRLLAERFLDADMKGEELINGLRCANEEMLDRVEDGGKEEMLQAYAGFVEEWWGTVTDVNLKTYLISSLVSLIRRVKRSPSLLAAHIRLLVRSAESGDGAKILRTARKYTSKAPRSAEVWVGRLTAERQLGSEQRHEMNRVWAEARVSVADGSEEEKEQVWLWGLKYTNSGEDERKIHEMLLKESVCDPSLRDVHEQVLMSYVTHCYVTEGHVPAMTHEGDCRQNGLTSDQLRRRLSLVRHMAGAYLPTGRVWQTVFKVEREEEYTDADAKQKILGEVYEMWRRKDGVEATVEWAGWLLRNGKGRQAKEAVVGARSWVGEERRAELEKRWQGIVDGDK